MTRGLVGKKKLLFERNIRCVQLFYISVVITKTEITAS